MNSIHIPSPRPKITTHRTLGEYRFAIMSGYANLYCRPEYRIINTMSSRDSMPHIGKITEGGVELRYERNHKR